MANAVGLPGLTAMPWKIISPRAAIASTTRSRSPTELPPEKTMRSAVVARVERRDQRVDGVLCRPMSLGNAAVRRDDRAEREAVHVEDLSGRQRLPRIDHLVARGKNRDARPGEHVDLRAADGGQRADAARATADRLPRTTRSPATMSAPRRPTFCPAAAGANTSMSWSPLFAVSSTITTASAPAGSGAPVAISAQVPGVTVTAEIWPV